MLKKVKTSITVAVYFQVHLRLQRLFFYSCYYIVTSMENGENVACVVIQYE